MDRGAMGKIEFLYKGHRSGTKNKDRRARQGSVSEPVPKSAATCEALGGPQTGAEFP